MGDIKKELEALIQVDSVVSLHVMPSRYRTTVCGWQKQTAILLARPIINNRILTLWHSQACTVRFLSGGNACGFNATVLDWDNRPHDPLFRITWPSQIEIVPFRQFERIQVTCPCELTESTNKTSRPAPGMLRDLSIGGCRVRTAQPLAEGAAVTLDFTLPDGFFLEQVAGTVCSIKMSGNEAVLGIKFNNGQNHVLSDVAFFVRTALGRAGRRQKPDRRVLIIDDDIETATPLLKAFEDRECEVTSANGLVDGFFRLRVALPNMLLINQQLQDQDVVRVCATIRHTRGFENLPMFVYGVDGNNSIKMNGLFAEIFDGKTNPARISEIAIQHVDTMREPGSTSA